MPFIVFEQDPLIRADIRETIAEEFADHLIADFDSIKSAWQDAIMDDDSYVVVLSVPAAAVLSDLVAVAKAIPKARFLVIGNDETSEKPDARSYTYLQRPFSSITLMESIRSVLSDQPEDRS